MTDWHREVTVIAAAIQGEVDGKQVRAQLLRIRRFHQVWCSRKRALTMKPFGTFWCVAWGIIDGTPTTSMQFLTKRGAESVWRNLNLPL